MADTYPKRDPVNGFVRYNAANAEDLAYLIRTGIIWRAGPKAKQAAVVALIEGTIPMPDRLPDEVRTFVMSARPR